jgi:hypothetical protein
MACKLFHCILVFVVSAGCKTCEYKKSLHLLDFVDLSFCLYPHQQSIQRVKSFLTSPLVYSYIQISFLQTLILSHYLTQYTPYPHPKYKSCPTESSSPTPPPYQTGRCAQAVAVPGISTQTPHPLLKRPPNTLFPRPEPLPASPPQAAAAPATSTRTAT